MISYLKLVQLEGVLFQWHIMIDPNLSWKRINEEEDVNFVTAVVKNYKM